MVKQNILIQSLVSVGAYSTAIVIVASTRMEFAPLFLVMAAGVLLSVISAPFIFLLLSITKSIKSIFPLVLCGLGATFAQTEAYSSLLFLAATQLVILFFMGATIACLWNLQCKEDGQTNQNRAVGVLLIIFVVTSPVIGYGIGIGFGKLSGEAASVHLSDSQLLQNLTDNDMQRRWDTGWYLASENPELLLRGVLHQNPDIAHRSIEAVQLFKAHSVIEQLEDIAESDPDEIRSNLASKMLSQIGDIP